MTAHVKSKHLGRRWRCPDCPQECTTKGSLARHIQRIHKKLGKILNNRNKSKRNIDQISEKVDLKEREYFADENGEDLLTDGAKMAKIRRLEKEVEDKNIEIQQMKDLISNLMQTNEALNNVN